MLMISKEFASELEKPLKDSHMDSRALRTESLALQRCLDRGHADLSGPHAPGEVPEDSSLLAKVCSHSRRNVYHR